MQPTRLPRKKDVVLQLLEQATVFVHLDPRGEAVRVPLWFKRQPQLVLQIGLNMAVPIPDLEVDDEGISCTLSFNRAPFLCVIPWAAVFALVDDQRQGMVWPDDVPPELAQQAAQQAKQAQARAELKVAPGPGPALVKEKDAAAEKDSKRRTKKTAAAKARPRAVAAAPVRAAKAARAVEPKVRAATPGAKPARTTAPSAKPAAATKRASAPAKAPAAKAPAPKAVPQKALKAAPVAQPTPAAAAGDGKRKLPPYLRIVK
jgi:stringent starvation protein B